MGWASFKRKKRTYLVHQPEHLGRNRTLQRFQNFLSGWQNLGNHKTLKTVRLCAVCSHVTLVNYSRKEPVPRGPRCSEQIMHRAERCQSAGELMHAQIKQELTRPDSSNLTRADLFGQPGELCKLPSSVPSSAQRSTPSPERGKHSRPELQLM